MAKYDFGGYATKNDIRCTDGRVIRANAFKHMHGQSRPIVYQHNHKDITQILGQVVFEHRDDGVYVYGKFDDHPSGQHALASVRSGSLNALSIHAVRVKQDGPNVLHGDIKEVSIVISGANPGALIEEIEILHSDGFTDIVDDEFIIHLDNEFSNVSFNHSGDVYELVSDNDNNITFTHAPGDDTEDPAASDDDDDAETQSGQEVFDSLTDEQEDLFKAILGLLNQGSVPNEEEQAALDEIYETLNDTQRGLLIELINMESDGSDNTATGTDGDTISQSDENNDINHTNQGDDNNMETNYNVFDQQADSLAETTLMHSELNAFIKKQVTSTSSDFREGFKNYLSTVYANVIEHSDTNEDEFLHSAVTNVETMFPDFKLGKEPFVLDNNNDWVNVVWAEVTKWPMTRVRTMYIDTKEDVTRALGHIKGKTKKEQSVKVLKRETSAKMVYSYMTMHREDIVTITEFKIVVFLYETMKRKLKEEVARAILLSDGRAADDDNKINEDNIRPIYKDDEVYTLRKSVIIPADVAPEVLADTIIDASIISRVDYKGKGTPVAFMDPVTLATMKTSKDKNGLRIYKSDSEIATLMGVRKVIEVPQMANLVHETKTARAIIVNLADYFVGTDKGGEITTFENFNLSLNKQEMLVETLLSGALCFPAAAIVIESTLV